VTTGTGLVSNINLFPHGMNTSSPYVLTSSLSPLPIELVSFDAACIDNQMHIQWTDASEINVMNIELQKSYDLNSWTTIYVASPSNLNSNTNYHYEYVETQNQVIYYRLKTNNNDGVSDISETIYTKPCGSGSEYLSAFSDKNIIYLQSQFENDTQINYSLYDIQGKLVLSGKYDALMGQQMNLIQLDQLSTAIYIFRAESNSIVCHQKLLITQP
jgi:hypothetical protein